MIAVDTNILVALHRTEYAHHKAAVRAVTSLAEGHERWAIPWPCIHEFIAVISNSRIFVRPTEPETALAVVDKLIASPMLHLIGEGPGYWEAFRRVVLAGQIAGARVHDARIAAICLQHRVTCLWTADRDFSRFPSLKCRNPLAGGESSWR